MLGGALGVMHVETGRVPGFHLFHGMIVAGKGLFGADGGDPGVYGLVICGEELVDAYVAHETERRRASAAGQVKAGLFTEC